MIYIASLSSIVKIVGGHEQGDDVSLDLRRG